MAKQFGLSTSIAGFDEEAYEGDLENELHSVGRSYMFIVPG